MLIGIHWPGHSSATEMCLCRQHCQGLQARLVGKPSWLQLGMLVTCSQPPLHLWKASRGAVDC